jgi:hypothetical protein
MTVNKKPIVAIIAWLMIAACSENATPPNVDAGLQITPAITLSNAERELAKSKCKELYYDRCVEHLCSHNPSNQSVCPYFHNGTPWEQALHHSIGCDNEAADACGMERSWKD